MGLTSVDQLRKTTHLGAESSLDTADLLKEKEQGPALVKELGKEFESIYYIA